MDLVTPLRNTFRCRVSTSDVYGIVDQSRLVRNSIAPMMVMHHTIFSWDRMDLSCEPERSFRDGLQQNPLIGPANRWEGSCLTASPMATRMRT